jgi:hypothetical protein
VIRLVDLHDKGGVPPGVEYIGRVGRTGKPPRSPLSNPYSVEKHGAQALRLYRSYLVNALATSDQAIVIELARLEALASAGGLVLGCWCVERPAIIEGLGEPYTGQQCHGDIVATVLTHWGIRLATYARARYVGDTTGPARWEEWLRPTKAGPDGTVPSPGCGRHPHTILASVFGMAEVRELAKVSDGIAAGMPGWMER